MNNIQAGDSSAPSGPCPLRHPASTSSSEGRSDASGTSCRFPNETFAQIGTMADTASDITPEDAQEVFSTPPSERAADRRTSSDARDIRITLTDDEAAEFTGAIQNSFIEGEKDITETSAAGLSPEDTVLHNQIVGEVSSVVQHQLDGGTGLAPASLGGPAQKVADTLHSSLESARLQTPDGQLTPDQRRQAILDALGHIARENMGGKAKRWGKNLAWTAAHTGIIIGVLTTFRQALGFSLEQQMMADKMSPASRSAFGTGISLIGPVLNLAGFIRDEVRHTATKDSRSARFQMLQASAVGILVPYLSGTSSVVPALLFQATFYTLTRDGLRIFGGLKSNMEGLEASAVTIAQSAYGVNQAVISLAMDMFAPKSGAGAAMGAPGTSTDWGQDATRGALNGTGECLDDVFFNGAHRMIQAHNNKKGIQIQAPAVMQRLAEALEKAEEHGRTVLMLNGDQLNAYVRTSVAEKVHEMTEGLRIWAEPRMPKMQDVFDQMLTTCAMRTSAFNATYAVIIAADALIGTNAPAIPKSILVNILAGSMLSYIYQPFINAHRQRSPAVTAPAKPAAQEMHELQEIKVIAKPDGLRRRLMAGDESRRLMRRRSS